MKSLRVFQVRNLSSLIAEEKTNKRKNHLIPLPTASTSFSGVLLSPPPGASERKLNPAGALHSTTARAPSYDLNSDWVSSVAHNRSRTNSCGVGSNVVDEGYEGPCSVIFVPRGAAVTSASMSVYYDHEKTVCIGAMTIERMLEWRGEGGEK